MNSSSASNPYAAPRAQVSDVYAEGQTQPVRFWPPSGRIGRLRLLAYSVAASLIMIPVLMVIGGVSALAGSEAVLWVLGGLVYAASLVFTGLLAVLRSHDMNWSGWLALLFLVPLVNFLFFLLPGTKGGNNFGAPPPPNTTAVKVLASLVLVIFVLGIVAAIALPAYQGYAERARAVQPK